MDHPIVRSRLTVMRDERSSNAEFRAALRELATLLVYEATRNLASTDVRVITPVGPARAARWPTPRCWCRYCGPAWAWPRRRSTCCRSRRWDSSGWPETRRPTSRVPTWRRCPTRSTGRPVLVLDPMLATGGSLLHCLQLLAARGAADITVVCALAAPEGVARIADSGLPPAVHGQRRRGAQRTPSSCRASATPATGSSAHAEFVVGDTQPSGGSRVLGT